MNIINTNCACHLEIKALRLIVQSHGEIVEMNAELKAQNLALLNLVNEAIELVCMSDTKRGTIDNRIKKLAWLKAAKQGKDNE